MLNFIEEIIQQYAQEESLINSTEDLLHIRNKYLGRKGIINMLLKELASQNIDVNDKKNIGLTINNLKKTITDSLILLEAKFTHITSNYKSIETPMLMDLSLPGSRRQLGSIHILTLVLEEVLEFFKYLGFLVVEEGTELDTPYYNFDALNVPYNHPARSLQDTFYINENSLLRTHTSGMQIKIMEQQKPPFKILAPGAVYRPDSDSTHTPMFHQIEGLCIEENITMANLFSIMEEFLRSFFGPNINIRRRPSYFPFTRPSAEFDIKSPNGRWIEILGCGMIHPYVLKNLKDSQKTWQGFAFGMGLERLTMLKYGLDDIRILFENDLRFLRQFENLL